MRWQLHLFTAALLTGAASVPPLAADFQPRTPPGWSWTGFYAGIHLGGGSARTDWETAGGLLAPFTPFHGHYDADGVVGGIQLGWNSQHGPFVWGLEAELSAADIQGYAKCARAIFVCENTIEALGTVTGRFGYGFDNVLLYLKAGGAAARQDYALQTLFFTNVLRGSETVWGWTVGAGVEFALGGSWSAKAEYNYIDLGGHTATLTDQFGGVFPIGLRQDVHLVKLGLNHRIGGATRLPPAASAAPLPDWTGFYLGAHFGSAWGRSDWKDPAEAITGGGFAFSFGNRDIDGALIGGQIGVNLQAGAWVFGAEATAAWSDLDGNATCFDSAGAGLTCHTRISRLGTITGRLGGVAGNALIYAKVGGAWAHADYDIQSLFVSASASDTRWGWAAGGGIEYALAPQWSVRAEYNYLHFGDKRISFTNVAGDDTPPTIGHHIHTVTTGLNYRFGGRTPTLTLPRERGRDGRGASEGGSFAGWLAELGSRYWFSSGRIQKDLFDPFTPARLNSRLSHEDLIGHSGEVFARLDHHSGVLLKGNFGGGNLSNGALIDEDFPGVTAYSNTFSDIGDSRLRYASLDAGFNFLNSPHGKLGAFVGYRHWHQRSNGFGCRQDGPDVICAPPISERFLALSETNTWRGVAVGLNARMPLDPRLTLEVDAAYVAYASLAAIDNHWFRADINPLIEPGEGRGAQVEALLSYALTEQWSVGAGGRYWFFVSDAAYTQFPNVARRSPMQFYSERYGAFLQSSYKFGADPALVARAAAPSAAPVHWTGLYAGVYLGAGRAQTDWTNPFGPQIFGDDIGPGGALAGGQIGFNYQHGAFVAGVEADASWANLEGSNTCFVGLGVIGGVNCRAEIDGVASVAGRLGYAHDRNLFFVKGGAAWARTDYELNLVGFGGAVSRSGSDRSGWLVGAGIARAITPAWSLKLEYDYLDFGSDTVSFNVSAPINRVPIDQQLHIFKLGANYRFFATN